MTIQLREVTPMKRQCVLKTQRIYEKFSDSGVRSYPTILLTILDEWIKVYYVLFNF